MKKRKNLIDYKSIYKEKLKGNGSYGSNYTVLALTKKLQASYGVLEDGNEEKGCSINFLGMVGF